MAMKRSIFAELYVKNSYRAKYTPRVSRPWRPRVIAWAGPAAFYQTRFSERNKWYKARIQMPEHLPDLHIIEPTDYYRTLAERIQVDEDKYATDIGFKKRRVEPKKPNLSEEELEKRARWNELLIDIDSLENDNTMITHHFNVFEDLFGRGAYFYNTQDVNVNYGEKDSVRFGNVISSSLSTQKPTVSIESGKNGFTSMLMLNLEGGILEQTAEDAAIGGPQLVHWLVSNIEDGKDVDSGNQNVPYLQPIPFYGTGFHRIAFIFFRHTQRIDVDSFFKLKSDSLFDRVFYTRKFAKHFEDAITPSALRFCQMSWDESCDRTLAQLGMKSPRFWYDWNVPMKPPQVEFPMKPMPFDLYLDLYRNPKEVKRTLAREWLDKRIHEGKVEKTKYPDIFYAENKKTMPAWLHQRHIDKNMGKGVYARFYSDFVNPAFQSQEAKA